MIDGCAAIHLGLLTLRGISSIGPFGQAKQCVINDFDTDYLLSADELMANILHVAHNMDEETSAQGAPVPHAPPLPSLRSSLLVAVHTAAEDTPRGVLVVVMAFPTSAAHVAAWTTSCPHAMPMMTPF
jgi:hypothetical protein